MGMTLSVLVALAAAAGAQAQGPVATEAAQASAPPAQVDAAKLGVSMSRIQRGLRISESREQLAGTPLRLEYQIQVYGKAPRIDFLEDFSIGTNAPLSYGAPTHNDFLNHWTPQAYRSPRVPISALAGWALFQLVKRADKAKCEQEIADYRTLVMQGVPTAPPRCTQ